jgi:hypothetical protein
MADINFLPVISCLTQMKQRHTCNKTETLEFYRKRFIPLLHRYGFNCVGKQFTSRSASTFVQFVSDQEANSVDPDHGTDLLADLDLHCSPM